MVSSLLTIRHRTTAVGALVATLLAGGLVLALSSGDAATAETSAVADAIEELTTTDQMRTDLEAALTALADRTAQSSVLLDSTAGRVLDEAVRLQLQADRDAAAAVAVLAVPTWQADAEKLLADVAAAQVAYDSSVPAVTESHQKWVIATTPSPPAPAAPKKSSSTGGSGSGSRSDGGATSGGGSSDGGGGSPSGGGGGLEIIPGNPNWDNPVGPGTTIG